VHGAIRLSDFPPTNLAAFLRLCAGEWLTVRSRFQLEESGDAEGGLAPAGRAELVEPVEGGEPGPFGPDDPSLAARADQEHWHDSARGALLVTYLEPTAVHQPGGMAVTPPAPEGGPGQPLHLWFQAEGVVERLDAAGNRLDEGTWRFWNDGSLELSQSGDGRVVRERIWFTKPNLRLRSSVERLLDGTPARACFSSEIRRVSRPAP
jgi:hypothetical protein